jgi:phosphoribosylformylglycinamidine synthase
LKNPGNVIYQVGLTRGELGGSHFALVENATGGDVPQLDGARAKGLFAALHKAIRSGVVLACHDLSEGGLAVAAAEMAFSGGCGARIALSSVPNDLAADGNQHQQSCLMFSESNSRFLCEVPADQCSRFESCLAGQACARIGEVTDDGMLMIADAAKGAGSLIRTDIESLKRAWQEPLSGWS